MFGGFLSPEQHAITSSGSIHGAQGPFDGDGTALIVQRAAAPQREPRISSGFGVVVPGQCQVILTLAVGVAGRIAQIRRVRPIKLRWVTPVVVGGVAGHVVVQVVRAIEVAHRNAHRSMYGSKLSVQPSDTASLLTKSAIAHSGSVSCTSKNPAATARSCTALISV